MDTYVIHRRCIIVIVLLGVVTGVSGFLDFTCYSAKARIVINADNDMLIGGFKSGSDTTATVTFGRTSYTGTSYGIPSEWSQTDHSNKQVFARLLKMPRSSGVDRIGAFYCEASYTNGVVETITTIIMSASSAVRPREISQTVSFGEPVTFVVDKNDDVPTLRWRHNDNYLSYLDDRTTYRIQSVTTAHAGVYECHEDGRRDQGIHAIFLLVVRACPSGKWGPQDCRFYCPTCLNGGICDERSGTCVCAPGFKGTHCLEAVGRNNWGQDGGLVCSSDNNDACRGRLFCLPHPYGCSCAAGYQGLDCNQDCSPGTYGASCRSQCHCKSSASCATDTGVCDGQCEDGWSGVNCQPTPNLVAGLVAAITENTIVIAWEPDESICIQKDYKVEYALTNPGQCGSVTNPTLITAGQTSSTSYAIDDLYYFSTYTVRVSTVLNNTFTGPPASTSPQKTSKTVPYFKPTVTSSANQTFNGLFFSWDNVPCALINGVGRQYEYELSANDIQSGSTTRSTTNVQFNNLIECKEYSFRVRATNDISEGEWSNSDTISTRMIHPGRVNMLDVAQGTSPFELHVTWKASSENNCPETRYIIKYTLLVEDKCLPTNGQPMVKTSYSLPSNGVFMATIENLIPYSVYNVSISAVNSAGQGASSFRTQTTNALAPSGPPSDVTAADVTSNTIMFKWSEPQCGQRHGDIIGYSFRLTNTVGEIVSQNMTSATMQLIENLSPFTNYSFKVAAETEKGPGPDQLFIQATAESVPSKPLDSKAVNFTGNSIIITWQTPRYPNGIINKYLIQKKVIAKPYDVSFSPMLQHGPDVYVDVTKMIYTLEGLKPSTKYEVNISAVSMIGSGDVATLQLFTLPASSKDIPAPMKLSQADHIGEITSTTVAISIPLSDSEYVTGYQVSIVPIDVRRKRQTSLDMHVVAELPKDKVDEDQSFLIGDNETRGSYYNPPLDEDATYTLYIGFVSRINETTVGVSWSEGLDFTVTIDSESLQVWIPIVCIIIVLCVIALVLGIFVLKRKRQKQRQRENGRPSTTMLYRPQSDNGIIDTATTNQEQGVDNNTNVNPEDSRHSSPPVPSKSMIPSSLANVSGPIKLTKFESYVQAKKESQTNSFKADFATLPGDNLHPWKAAKKEENIKKNRYGNITTYDNSRVILQPLDGDPHSDFINASFIDGVNEEKRYIASQGPNKASVDDFWRMIWQYNVRKIVMLTMLYETGKVKCQQYWPSEEIIVAGVTITPKTEEMFVDFVIRIFELRTEAFKVVREVRQYHFTSWPDMSVPQSPILLNFMKVVNTYQPNEAPPIIHCSAGVGRTGTYITIDSMLEQAKRDNVVDVYSFVSKMRNKRMKMVQTSSQYRFIFDALLEAFTSGDTAIESEAFESQFTKLLKQGSKSGLTKQFKALDKLTVWPHENKFKGGLDPVNASRNRYPDIIPADRNRPFLMTDMSEVDGTSSNYINATFVNGYRTKDQFIVTQTPLPDTVADIWRLLYDHSSNIIVMLNHLDYKDPSMIKYWPDRGSSANFGPLKVTCVEQDESTADMIVRTFQLSNSKNKSEGTRTIRQFVLQTWSAEEDEAQSPDSIVALVRSLKQHYDNESLKHITVHCIDGVGASCVFSAIMMVLDQIEHSQTIDIFQAVRRLRLIRPQAVRNLAQYTFCYKVIQAHLKSSELYENLQQQQRQSQQDNQQIYANYNVDGDATGPKVGEGAIYANVNL